MKITAKLLFVIVFIFSVQKLSGQTNISGVINSYAKVTSINSAVCGDSLSVNTTQGFATGDSVMLIQMQGADIDTSNTVQFGTINSYGKSGNFEFLKINTITGNTIRFTSSLKRSYDLNGNVQLVTKPVYTNANVTSAVTALPWNGSTGGVLTFSVTNTLTLNADADATGNGFRGGSVSTNYWLAWYYDFCFGATPARGGKKGESIAPYLLNKEYGRGAPANGGGGGNDINTGGGGGGNFGAGGHGGNNFFSPDTLWGLRGRGLSTTINQGRIYLGGGGGGGHQDNNTGTAGSNGGGIIAIYANTIIGNGHAIKANGTDIVPVANIDGAGGAGAGGSIIIDAINFNTNLTIEAKGGKGGDQIYQPQCHGNGGGGGGGLIINTHAAFPGNVTTNVTGGNRGTGQCNNTVNDAAAGEPGTILFNWHNDESIILNHLNVSCFGGQDGSASIVVTGNPPYQYVWTYPNGLHQSTDSISQLSAGNYNVTITNGSGCTFTDSTQITEPPQINVTITSINGNCLGASGSATAIASGGSGAFTYSWNTSPVQTTQTISNLTPGNYIVTVTDSLHCFASDTAILLNPTSATYAIHQTPASCLANDGSVSVSHAGSTGPFSYHWTPANDTTHSTITGLPAGLYSVIVTDLGTGCADSLAIIVANSAGINATIVASQNATCLSDENGSASVMASGGQPPYFYLWSNGDTTNTTNTLGAGTHLVRVEDYNGCPAYATVTIGYDNPAPNIVLGPDTQPCVGTPYLMDAGSGFASYLWSDNSTGQTLTVSTSGTYSVLVTDSMGCQGYDLINVTFITCMGPVHPYSTTSRSHFTVYPNPVRDDLHVYINGVHKNEVILTLYDLLGNKIFAIKEIPVGDNLQTIKLNELPPGIYIVKIEQNNRIDCMRIIKQ